MYIIINKTTVQLHNKEIKMTEENNTNTTNEETTEATEVTQEKIEVSWEQVLPVVRKVLEKNEAVSTFGRLLIEAESKKDALKERIISENRELQTLLDDLKTVLEIPEGEGWELDLPDNEGDSGFFVKKTE